MANLIYIEKKNWDIIYPFFKKYFNKKYNEKNRCITVNANKFATHVNKVLSYQLDDITDEIVEGYKTIEGPYYIMSHNTVIHIYEEEKIAYKAFKVENCNQLYCQPEEKFYYEEGNIYKIKNGLKLCEKGFHFCKKMENVFNFYGMLSDVKVHKVEILGDVINSDDGEKSCTDKIKILRKLEDFEIRKFIGDGFPNCQESYGILLSSAVFNSRFIKNSEAVNGSNYIDYSISIDKSKDVEYSFCIKNSTKIKSSESVNHSSFINMSESVNSSKSIFYSKSIHNSRGVLQSQAISNSVGVISSSSINNSIGVLDSSSISNGLFVYDMKCKEYVIFNKEVRRNKFDEIFAEAKWKLIHSINFSYSKKRDCTREYLNWKNCSQFFDFIKSLDEYDENIFNKIIKEGVLI